ncbi:MAG: RagB/SusD family nutrient uptake outer membrane protein [Bacteroides sp.]|nr:RagB/SusD family nutrient uptake outer membrane protein [Bacteroides sp.]
MKKLLISSILTGALFTSCSLTEEPVGQLNDLTALETFDNLAKYRNGFYNTLRGFTAGAYIGYTDIQADMFIGMQNNGNTLGVMSIGNFSSNTTDLTGAWSNPYASIASVNYFLHYCDLMLESDEITEEEKIQLQLFRGEAKWTRAYSYYYLVDHFCQAYTLTDPDAKASGVPIVTVYDPTSDYAKYPGRNTLKESFDLIEQDLADAYDDMSAYEQSLGLTDRIAFRKPNSYYLNTSIVQAFQARIALLRGEYALAVEKAEAVISNTNYKLCTTRDYSQIWTNDTGNELLFVLYGDQVQATAVTATGSIWINADPEKADYVAAANALAMYDEDNDVRYDTFFEERSLKVEGSYYSAPCFIKYPGNPSLNTTSTNALKNLPKPFRLSETYLILAEAAAASGDATKANKALNDIRKARLYNYEEQTYSGTTLINEIRAERTKELIGEGFRISDLRRWNLGFTRSTDYTSRYQEVAEVLVYAGTQVTYLSGDYRYVWPIPKDELEANPQIANEQNPGY